MNGDHTSGRDELLSARAAARLLPGAGAYQSLLRWARQGSVPAVQLPGGRWYFRRGDIEALLTPTTHAAGDSLDDRVSAS